MFYHEQKYIVYGNPFQIALSLFVVIQLKTYQKNKTTLFWILWSKSAIPTNFGSNWKLKDIKNDNSSQANLWCGPWRVWCPGKRSFCYVKTIFIKRLVSNFCYINLSFYVPNWFLVVPSGFLVLLYLIIFSFQAISYILKEQRKRTKWSSWLTFPWLQKWGKNESDTIDNQAISVGTFWKVSYLILLKSIAWRQRTRSKQRKYRQKDSWQWQTLIFKAVCSK